MNQEESLSSVGSTLALALGRSENDLGPGTCSMLEESEIVALGYGDPRRLSITLSGLRRGRASYKLFA